MNVILLSIPGLRKKDLDQMPNLQQLCADGDSIPLAASFPAVTCPVQANMTTGKLPNEHGVVANGFFWREKSEIEMWTAWNEVIESPQIWDKLHEHDPSITSAAWFPLLVKGSGVDYVCTPAPIHNPDGTESMWCQTRPEDFYQTLLDDLGHFPLHHFWGPIAGIQGSAWIVDSACKAAKEFTPNFFYIYLPHLDYAAQKNGPDSPEAMKALADLDAEIGKLVGGVQAAYGDAEPLWLVASEYAIVPVDHVAYPNRILRDAGLLEIVTDEEGRETLDYANCQAWAMVDHQFAQVFVKDRNPAIIEQVTKLFQGQSGIAQVIFGEERSICNLAHERAGDVILISEPNSWQAYYWWKDDAAAPAFARNVDIHQKPGYDPVELFFDPKTKGIPLDATLVKGSHGAPVLSEAQNGVLLTSKHGVVNCEAAVDKNVAGIVLKQFGAS